MKDFFLISQMKKGFGKSIRYLLISIKDECFIIAKNAELICQIMLLLHVVFMIASLYETQLSFSVASMEFLRNLNYESQWLEFGS
jgi:hypothetical protein